MRRFRGAVRCESGERVMIGAFECGSQVRRDYIWPSTVLTNVLMVVPVVS